MDIQINAVKFKADARLEEFINKKVEKLNLFYDGVMGAEVRLVVDADEKPENKIVDINIKIPGADLFSSKQADTFEAATDQSVEALRRQLKKHKEKLREK